MRSDRITMTRVGAAPGRGVMKRIERFNPLFRRKAAIEAETAAEIESLRLRLDPFPAEPVAVPDDAVILQNAQITADAGFVAGFAAPAERAVHSEIFVCFRRRRIVNRHADANFQFRIGQLVKSASRRRRGQQQTGSLVVTGIAGQALAAGVIVIDETGVSGNPLRPEGNPDCDRRLIAGAAKQRLR